MKKIQINILYAKPTLMFFSLFILPCFLQAQTDWKISSSAVTFTIKNAGLTVDGSFGGLAATISFDTTDLKKASMDAKIEANTVNTGINSRDTDLKKSKYFDVTKYPQINLRSTSFTKEKEGSYKGVFKLTMKGVSKYVIIPFSFKTTEAGAVFNGSFSLNRRDYDVGGNSWILSDDVIVFIKVHVVRK